MTLESLLWVQELLVSLERIETAHILGETLMTDIGKRANNVGISLGHGYPWLHIFIETQPMLRFAIRIIRHRWPTVQRDHRCKQSTVSLRCESPRERGKRNQEPAENLKDMGAMEVGKSTNE